MNWSILQLHFTLNLLFYYCLTLVDLYKQLSSSNRLLEPWFWDSLNKLSIPVKKTEMKEQIHTITESKTEKKIKDFNIVTHSEKVVSRKKYTWLPLLYYSSILEINNNNPKGTKLFFCSFSLSVTEMIGDSQQKVWTILPTNFLSLKKYIGSNSIKWKFVSPSCDSLLYPL